MTITIDLQPETENSLLARAKDKGISLTDYVSEIVIREAHLPSTELAPSAPSGQDLIDVCAEIRGVLTDAEIDTLFARNRSLSRSVEL